jgi:hypothetical protein
VTLLLLLRSPAGTGTNFTRTQTDAEGLSDSPSLVALGRFGTESLGLTDATVINQTKGISDTEDVTGSNALTQTKGLTDPEGLTDTASVASIFSSTVTDSEGLTDSTTVDLIPAPAWSVLQETTGTTGTTTPTSYSVTLPSATTGGSVIIIVNSDATVSTPAGFVVDGTPQVFNNGHYVFRKASSTGETSWTVSPTGAASGVWWVAEITGLPSGLDKTSGTGSSTSAATRSTGTTTTTASANELAIASFGGSQAVNPPVTFSGETNGFTERVTDATTTKTSGTNVSLAVASKVLSATGTVESTATGSTSAPGTAIVVTYPVQVGATGFTRTVDDPENLTDTAAVASAFVRTQDDPEGLTDTVAPSLTRILSDTEGLADTPSPVSAFATSVTDAEGLTDAPSAQLSSANARQIDDPESLTDTAALTQSNVLSDAEGLADTASPASVFSATITDAEGLTDSASGSLSSGLTRQVDDPEGLTDVVALVDTEGLTDPEGLTDTATQSGTFVRTITDAEGLSDSPSLVALGRFGTEPIGLSDNAVPNLTSPNFVRTVTDSLALTDLDNLQQIDYVETLTESLGLADTATQTGTFVRTQTDAEGLSDTATPVLNGGAVNFTRTQTDNLGLTDSTSVYTTLLAPATLAAWVAMWEAIPLGTPAGWLGGDGMWSVAHPSGLAALFSFGDTPVRKSLGSRTLTGATATGAGTATTKNYIIATDGDATDISIGDRCQIYDSGGTLRHASTLDFVVTQKNSAFGFTNIVFNLNLPAVTVSGDVLKVHTGGNDHFFPNSSAVLWTSQGLKIVSGTGTFIPNDGDSTWYWAGPMVMDGTDLYVFASKQSPGSPWTNEGHGLFKFDWTDPTNVPKNPTKIADVSPLVGWGASLLKVGSTFYIYAAWRDAAASWYGHQLHLARTTNLSNNPNTWEFLTDSGWATGAGYLTDKTGLKIILDAQPASQGVKGTENTVSVDLVGDSIKIVSKIAGVFGSSVTVWEGQFPEGPFTARATGASAPYGSPTANDQTYITEGHYDLPRLPNGKVLYSVSRNQSGNTTETFFGDPSFYRPMWFEVADGPTDTVTINDSENTTDAVALTSTEGITDAEGLTDSVSVSTAGANTRSISDDENLTDTANQLGTFIRTQTDSENLTDTVTTVANYAPTQSDTEQLSDTATSQKSSANAVQIDDIESLDDTSKAFAFSATVNDDTGLTDLVSNPVSFPRTQSDADNLTDTTFVEVGKSANITDAEGLTDTAAATRAVTVSEIEALDDANLTYVGTWARVITDSAGLTDTFSVQGAGIIQDNLGLSDSIVSGPSVWYRDTDDVIGTSDVVTPALARGIQTFLDDPEGLSDTIGLTRPINITDLVSVEDTNPGDIGLSWLRSLTDAEGLTETLIVTHGISQTDNENLTDNTFTTNTYLRPITTDFEYIDDVVILTGDSGRIITETETLSDSEFYAEGVYVRAQAETEGLSDTTTIVKTLEQPIIDTMGLADTLTRVTPWARLNDDLLFLTDDLAAGRIVPRSTADVEQLFDAIIANLHGPATGLVIILFGFDETWRVAFEANWIVGELESSPWNEGL